MLSNVRFHAWWETHRWNQAVDFQARALVVLARRGGRARGDEKALWRKEQEEFLQAQPRDGRRKVLVGSCVDLLRFNKLVTC